MLKTSDATLLRPSAVLKALYHLTLVAHRIRIVQTLGQAPSAVLKMLHHLTHVPHRIVSVQTLGQAQSAVLNLADLARNVALDLKQKNAPVTSAKPSKISMLQDFTMSHGILRNDSNTAPAILPITQA